MPTSAQSRCLPGDVGTAAGIVTDENSAKARYDVPARRALRHAPSALS